MLEMCFEMVRLANYEINKTKQMISNDNYSVDAGLNALKRDKLELKKCKLLLKYAKELEKNCKVVRK